MVRIGGEISDDSATMRRSLGMVCHKKIAPLGGSFADREGALPLFGQRRYPATQRWRILFGEISDVIEEDPAEAPPSGREARRSSSGSK